MSSSGYDFSQLFHAHTLAFSPGTTFLVTAYNNRIIIRSTSTLSIVRTFQCLLPASTSAAYVIDSLQWSSDSMYLLAYASKVQAVWVFGLTETGDGEGGEMARLGGEVEGLAKVEWGKAGREILAWSDHGLRLTIYDLATGDASCIQYPKSPLNCHTFSPDGRYLAIVERHGGKDHVGVYDAQAGYRLVRHFALQTIDIQSLTWSPCGRYLAAVDSALSYSLHIYSPLGPQLCEFSPNSATFSADSISFDPGLGIRTVSWAPGGRWIALGGWDGKVRIVESDGWRCVAVMSWGGKTGTKETVVWKEPPNWLRETRGHGIVQFDKIATPASFPSTREDVSKSRGGVTQIAFDEEATLLLVRLDTQPHVVHIHSFLPDLTSINPHIKHVASLIMTETVRSAKWSPKTSKLAISSRSGGVYFWDASASWVEEGKENEETQGGLMEGVGIPSRTDFAVHDVVFSPDGKALAICDKEQFCLLYDNEVANVSAVWDHGLAHEGLSEVQEEDEKEFNMISGFSELPSQTFAVRA
ncbi:hypothetical protein BCR39DRAFT_548449 [Naematelia encephala]|uniref:WD40-repeat-containing domain protein n=1 Tax=Naematelia encephala TaxID=71784 RepID=A0A1Y2APS6_9TREE|nr:hypothetical protein BCR39DRAFT_548449 [Naematelia encephala]